MFLFSNLKIGHCCQISAEKGDFENLENIFKTKVNTRTAAYNEIVKSRFEMHDPMQEIIVDFNVLSQYNHKSTPARVTGYTSSDKEET